MTILKQMHRYHALSAGLFAVVMLLLGCPDRNAEYKGQFLLKAGGSVITVGDYIDALEVAKVAYAHSELKQSDTFRKLQLRIFSQLAEEIIVMEIAREKNITITDAELTAGITDVKKDYPEGVFEEMLLENAITYDLWKKTLYRRLLMEKVLDRELALQIEITPEIIEEYYKKHKQPVDAESEIDSETKYSRLIKKIRLEKKQENYQNWIEEKKKDYSIEVNEKVWEKITGAGR